jgi:hypothetical protein
MSEPKNDVKDFMQAISSLVDKDMFNNLVNQIVQEEIDEEAILNDEKVLASLPNIETDLNENDIHDISNLKSFYYIQSDNDALTAYELLIEDLYRENKGLKIKKEKTDEIMNELQTLFPNDDDEFERIWDGETLHDALTKIYEIVFDG